MDGWKDYQKFYMDGHTIKNLVNEKTNWKQILDFCFVESKYRLLNNNNYLWMFNTSRKNIIIIYLINDHKRKIIIIFIYLLRNMTGSMKK